MSALVGIAVVVGLAAAFVAGVLLELAAVKAEVEKIEAEAKAEEQAVVARLKKLF